MTKHYDRDNFTTMASNRFGYTVYNLSKDLFDRFVDEEIEDDEEALNQSFKDGFIYTADKWAVMGEYQSPEDADFARAEMEYFDELLKFIRASEIRAD